jgi:hypothetical protein
MIFAEINIKEAITWEFIVCHLKTLKEENSEVP